MSPDEFIEAAIDAGFRNGVEALNADQRLVFLISEAEVCCDMDGIDSFLNRYNPDWLPDCASAFEEVGAREIAAGFRAIQSETQTQDSLLQTVNDLVTSRAGYDYESIRRVVESRLSNPGI